MENILDWISINILKNNELISSLFGAGFGASFAFLLENRARIRACKNEECEKLIEFSLTISGILNHLLNLREQIWQDEEYKSEYERLGAIVKEGHKNMLAFGTPNIGNIGMFRKISIITINGDIDCQLDEREIMFLAKYNPKIINFIKAYINLVRSFNASNKKLSQHLEGHHTTMVNVDFSEVEKWFSFLSANQSSAEKILGASEMLFKIFISIGRAEYTDFNIKGITVPPEYKITPFSGRGWDDLKDYRPKNWIEKNFPTFIRLFKAVIKTHNDKK